MHPTPPCRLQPAPRQPPALAGGLHGAAQFNVSRLEPASPLAALSPSTIDLQPRPPEIALPPSVCPFGRQHAETVSAGETLLPHARRGGAQRVIIATLRASTGFGLNANGRCRQIQMPASEPNPKREVIVERYMVAPCDWQKAAAHK